MTIPISKRAQALKPSPTMSVTALASKMAAEGISIINFGVGEPDFNTPENIKQAAHQALDANFTHYTVSAGILELRQAICDKLKRDNNLDYSPDEIIVAPGGKAAIITTLAAICDPDDEIIIPAPSWVSYPSQVEMLDGKPVFIATDESTNFKITVREFEFAAGAGFIIPILGDMMRMPGLPNVPAAEGMHIDKNGKITGLS